MSPAVCTFCSNANPSGSAFCNECGAALNLMLCKACEAVNDRSATHCYNCGSELSPASSVAATIDAPSVPRANDLLTDTFALAATHATVDELELGDSGQRLAWPRRRLNPAFVIVPLCALAAVGYYAYQRRDTTAPTPPGPATREIRLQNPAATGVSPGSRDEPQQSPATGSVIVAEPSVTRRTEAVTAPAAVDGGINDEGRQSTLQPGTKDAPTSRGADSNGQASQADAGARQKPRGVKRDNGLASSRSKSGELPAPGTARSFERREQRDFRPPAKCTDAVAALALCSRDNPTQGR